MVHCSLLEQTLWHIETENEAENRSRPTTDSSFSERWTHVRPTGSQTVPRPDVPWIMCVLWSSALETFVSISDLWAKDGKDSSHVFEIHFQTPHSYYFSLHRSAVCQNYLFAWFYDGNTGKYVFRSLTIKQRPGTAIRITFIFILNCLSGHLWTSELWHIGCSWCWNHVWHQKELFCYWRQWPSGRLHDCPWARCGCPLVNTKQLLNWLDLP